MITVTIYSTPTCGFCKQLKEFLEDNNIEYEDFNVLEDKDALQEMQELSGGSLSVPLIVFNKGEESQEIQNGFHPEKIRSILSL